MIIEALKAFLIGIVEGITEWLPISSTGHMILVDEFVKLQVSDEFLALFLVVIQLGAIMAVLILYFHKLNPFSPKKDAVEKKSTWRLWGMVAIGCIPAAVIGLLFDDLVNEYFYNKVTVAAMLILYGVVFIVLERRNRRRLREAEAALEAPRGRHARVSYGDVSDEAEASLFKITDVDEIDWKTALKIGCFQVLAIIPGTSRSGATIIGGMLAGCSRTAAAEFTFFLAIPIMFGWGLVKCIKFVAAGIAMTSTEILVLAVGIITAFAMSVVGHQVPHGLYQEERLHRVRLVPHRRRRAGAGLLRLRKHGHAAVKVVHTDIARFAARLRARRFALSLRPATP